MSCFYFYQSMRGSCPAIELSPNHTTPPQFCVTEPSTVMKWRRMHLAPPCHQTTKHQGFQIHTFCGAWTCWESSRWWVASRAPRDTSTHDESPTRPWFKQVLLWPGFWDTGKQAESRFVSLGAIRTLLSWDLRWNAQRIRHFTSALTLNIPWPLLHSHSTPKSLPPTHPSFSLTISVLPQALSFNHQSPNVTVSKNVVAAYHIHSPV